MYGTARWLHRRRGHTIHTLRVSIPLWDRYSRGLLHECSCGKTWVE